MNFERFVEDYGFAIRQDFTKIYAIARSSKVSAIQFEHFCAAIGTPCREASISIRRLFNSSLIDVCFETREFAFNAQAIATDLAHRLNKARIDVRLGNAALITQSNENCVTVETCHNTINAAFVFNCTYAQLDRCGATIKSPIKRELAELALFVPPPELKSLGITVMDGPFFSTMPFPPAGLYSLSHVRYTPHEVWTDEWPATPPIIKSHSEWMVRDALRYLPDLAKAQFVRSIYDLKAVLVRNEVDDGRPILVEHDSQRPRVLSVLGSKIDNIYDVKAYLRQQKWEI